MYNKRLKISKSAYIKGIQCHKSLWFYFNRHDLKLPVSPGMQSIFDSGHEVGLLAQKLFEDGIEISEDYTQVYEASLTTKEKLENGVKVLFEAAAISPNGAYSRIDVLKKVKNKFHLYEVKGSTSIKDVYLNDLALQYYVFKNAGFDVSKAHLIYINNKYVKQGEIEPKKIFIIEDVTPFIEERLIFTEKNIKELLKTLEKEKEPITEIGSHCFGIKDSPYECDFVHHCWSHVPDYSVWDIFARNSKNLKELVDKNILEIENIPEEYITSKSKLIEVSSYKNEKIFSDKIKIKEFLNKLTYPIYYLDYETVGSAIPIYDGTKPFEQIPYQFSLHIQENKNSKLKHIEFLHTEKTDPRKFFIKKLIESCDKQGSIVVYNQPFEEGINKALINNFPEYKKDLLSINERMVDLFVPFRSRAIYHYNQKGSASIKAVLPAFVPEMNYENLHIKDGGDATFQYLKLIKVVLNQVEKDEIIKNLKIYCGQDTLAMVRLVEVLKNNI